MKRYRLSFVAAGALTTAVLFISIDYAAGQEIALAPMQAAEVAKGYRAEALRLKTVINRETIGRINDFVFGQDGNIYAVLAVDDQTGLSSHVIAIPFRSLKIDDRSGYIVLPGASREALQKLPVFVSNR
jgi:hypothetical protein